jgi:lipoprotein signal peptidase
MQNKTKIIISLIFAVMIVCIDQFFKSHIRYTIELGEYGREIVPDIVILTYWENSGTMLGILADMQLFSTFIGCVFAAVLIAFIVVFKNNMLGKLAETPATKVSRVLVHRLS